MRISFLCLFATFFLIVACKPVESDMTVNYPKTFKDETIQDDYHGHTINDPYRWLEDDHSEETKAWVTSQNNVTNDYMSKIWFKDAFRDRLETLWNYEKFSVPFEAAGQYYQYKNDGLQNQSVLYSLNLKDKSLTEILDPNSFSTDGTSSLGGISFSNKGKLLAYQVSEGGSDWRTIEVKNLENGQMTSDKVEWVKFSGISWKDDGFYYSRYPEPTEDGELSNANEFHALYYHKLGTNQSADRLVLNSPDHPKRNVYAQVSEDERFLVVSVAESTSGNGLKIQDLSQKNSPLMNVVDAFDSDYQFIGNEGSICFFQTNNAASNWKVVSWDANKPKAGFKEIVPTSKNTISGVSKIGNRLFVNYIANASSQVDVFELNGNSVGQLSLPGIGTLSGINGNKAGDSGHYAFTSFTIPNTVYEFDPITLESKVYNRPELDFPVDDYETRQLWYTSYDGTKIPMFVVHKKGLELDGKRPTMLYGYGGFDISILPSFNVTRLPIIENGGVYAVANIRGGGEFGKDWHKAGTLGQKQNVFNDFQAAAEFLIENKYTNSDKLAIEGRSNGGLLVGACMTQRPDLYAVAFPHVGVLDMLRYHEFTIGWAWAGDYGRSDESDAFDYLIKYSPLHNVKEVEYPATMVTTADHDDRVVPAHSFKFISELQDKHKGENPVLIRIETSAGHGAGKPTSKRIEESADLLAFMFHNMGEGVKYMKK